MIKINLEDGEVDDLEKKIYEDAVLITALVNSRKEKITPKMALLLGIWESLKGKTDKNGCVNLFVGLINNGLTDSQIEGFIKRIYRKYESQLKDKFKN
jgi:hypothetical protein